MALFMRRRKRTIKLNNRLGSRRNKLLISFSLALVALASWLVSSTTEDSRQTYLVAAMDLASNAPISDTTVSTIKLDLQETGSSYLTAETKGKNKFFVKSPLSAGQLIPMSSLLSERFQNCSAVVLALGAPMSSSIAKGDLIDIWSAEESASIDSIPVQIVTSGELISIKNATDGFSQNTQTIEVCVSVAEIRSVVQAITKRSIVVAVRADSQ